MKGDEFFKRVANQHPFSRMHPRLAAFFKDYLSNEKVITFEDHFVLNTHFPPYPSRAFENLVEHFSQLGQASTRQLFSVTLAVTNRCDYHCWHCYNAGRNQQDMPLSTLQDVVSQIQQLGVVTVTLSGGEPLLRDDLEEIVGSFNETTSLTLNTTGTGLTQARARALLEGGLFAVGVSLDSMVPDEHDRLRGKEGAFRTALQALRLAAENGLYPYIISVATRDFLAPSRFKSFMRFASESGALEVHLLEPSPTGKLAGNLEVLLRQAERERILDYQKEIAADESLPILSSFTYLESAEAFGCGAGLTHLYIDGSGEVCPCNLVPLSFGNATHEPLHRILGRMGRYFQKPRPGCVGRILASHIKADPPPTSPEVSAEICEKYLPRSHALPRFFRVRAEAQGEVGREELRSAYDQIHQFYDEFWLPEAAKPIEDLIDKLGFTGKERVFEAGCGTGYATVLMAEKLGTSGAVLAVDLSEKMLAQARRRVHSKGIRGIQFVTGDALEILQTEGPFDIIFSSWVLGYISLKPFFACARRALAKRGRVAFVVHKENSPYEPLEIFGELVSSDPSILLKRVAFDFPRDMNRIEQEVASAGLRVEHLSEGKVSFAYDTPREVLEHLLKSGAGTAYYEAVDPDRRGELEEEFLKRLAARSKLAGGCEVVHDYISCVARNP